MDKSKIEEIFAIQESFELPNKIMELIESNELNDKLTAIKHIETDLGRDGFADYFQENHSNRETMMQDYTPVELCRLVSELEDDFSSCLDICAGIGGLTIAMWNKNPDAVFYCEELSARAFPILLVNLALRNIRGYAIRKDILKQEIYEIYQLEKGVEFSFITKCEELPSITVDVVITNPPYSLKHTISKTDERFAKWGIPPKSKADYAFVIDGIRRLKPGGKAIAILPHGVLFRGAQEGCIRKEMIQKGVINAVIGLPEKLFLNTAIPTLILVFQNNTEDVLFIDASKSFEKEKSRNILTDIEDIANIYKKRWEIKRFSHNASLEEIKENDYNLNIPRYVDTYIPEPVPDIFELMDSMVEIDREIKTTEKELFEMMKQLTSNSCEIQKEITHEVDRWGQITLKL